MHGCFNLGLTLLVELDFGCAVHAGHLVRAGKIPGY